MRTRKLFSGLIILTMLPPAVLAGSLAPTRAAGDLIAAVSMFPVTDLQATSNPLSFEFLTVAQPSNPGALMGSDTTAAFVPLETVTSSTAAASPAARSFEQHPPPRRSVLEELSAAKTSGVAPVVQAGPCNVSGLIDPFLTDALEVFTAH